LLAFAAPQESTIYRQAGMFEPGVLPAEGLPNAEGEVRDIARLIAAGSDAIRTGSSGSEATLKQSPLERYKILHFATHAVVDEIVPRRSAVMLNGSGAEDGLLQINEIAQLRLNADVVVLAACRTQVGRALRGEGLLSLSRAFMHAGARGIVATLTPVRDAETRRFMRIFYVGLAGGLAPDQALRVAQLQMIRAGGADARPDVWAAFVLTGDGSEPVLRAEPISRYMLATVLGVVIVGAIPLLNRRRGVTRRT
jgi:CHAT domain-containing protein